ncbi:MAG TPA: AbrB/MazE/SpoVT family DNA-binding domain-containing protein [Thermomicrobiales bacterium]|jgi:AbrB family looped-hinge helix DNA binding protein|nr:AbrB/MazE/SpoVT family DNA-binding domain-containing protein [Thermomicrobiales bacterium]
MAVEPTFLRIEDNGQVTIPREVRDHLGLRPGDLVVLTETPEGILLTSREAVVSRALDDIGAALRESGLTLDELIESGREERGEVIRDWYGIDPADESE